MASDFHLIPISRDAEPAMLARAIEALEEVDPGETAFVSGPLATSPDGAAEAFVTLVTHARQSKINVVTSMHLGGESVADLVGHDPERRYHGVCIFTRHGVVHVPQAEVLTQAYATGGDEPIAPYDRLNHVLLDLDGELVSARFLLGADALLVGRFTPPEIAVEVLVAMGAFVAGGERKVARVMKLALDAGVAQTGMVAASYLGHDMAEALEHQHEQLLRGSRERPLDEWPQPRAFTLARHLYNDADAPTVDALLALPHQGRLVVPRSRWETPVTHNRYPVTVVL